MNTKRIIALVLLVAFMGVSAPLAASAQTYYYNQPYQARTLQEQVAYLYGVIAQLQLQLALLQRTGSVRGITYDDNVGSGRYDLEIDTNSARDIEEDEAILRGEVDLDGASYARVWFEYGEDGDLDDRTSVVRIERRGDDTRSFSRLVDDLEEDEVYYFRAAGEASDGSRDYGQIRTFRTDDNGFSRNDDEPRAVTDRADDVDEDSAVLRGEVDMNDFRNGTVFFVYGEDEDQVDDVERDYDSYSDVDEDGDDLQKVRVDSDLDGRDDYRERVSGLDEDVEHFFRICVEYEDEDDDEQLECGSVEDFTTDDNGGSSSSGDAPDVTTRDVFDIDDNAASFEGEVDVNDGDSVYAFFVYGQDEDDVEDATDEDEYNDIDRDGDRLNKTGVRAVFGNSADFESRVYGLDEDTRYYFVACVQYDDEDDDVELECGDIDDFRTDED